MTVDDRLRRASSEVRTRMAGVNPPPRRRPSWIPVAAGATLALALFVAVALLAADGNDGGDAAAAASSSQPAPPSSGSAATETSVAATTTVPTPSTSPPATTTPEVTAIAPPPPATVLLPAGDPFGAVAVTDSVPVADGTLLVGCARQGEVPAAFPAWTIGADLAITPADGPAGVACLSQVVSTPLGLYAQGGGVLVHSEDGRRWQSVEVPTEVPEWVQHIAAIGDRVTVISQRASLNETTVSTLYTTTDGVAWEAVDADIFDSADVSAIAPGGAGLLAVGASPGGQAPPTAAVWTTPDAITWERLTPLGEGFDGAFMTALIATDGGFVAVGGDLDSGLMAAWTSTDGLQWTRSPDPDDTPHEFGSMIALSVTIDGSGVLYAAGLDSDAARDGDTSVPALWRSDDGITWMRIDPEASVPFATADREEGRIGFWPPPGGADDDPVSVILIP